MKLERLVIENFMGIGKGEITFNKTGLTLIEGVNEDSPSSESNGAGKSSIFEALYWVLFGKTKRGLTGDAVVNRAAKKDCYVELLFSVGSTQYIIERWRKHSTEGNALKFCEVPEKLGEKFIELTKGTAKETQTLIEEVIKMDAETFSKVAHFGQGDVKAFADLKDAELKRVFEQALNLTYLSDQQGKIKAHASSLKLDLASKNVDIATLERDKAHVEEKIEYLTKAIKELADKKASEKTQIEADIKGEELGLENAKEMYMETEAGIKAKLAIIADREAKLNELETLKGQLAKKYNVKFENLMGLRARYDIARSGMEKHIAEMKKAPEKAGTDCDKCGREFTNTDIKTLVGQMGATLTKMNSNLKSDIADIDILEADANKLKALFDPLDAKLKELSDVKVKQAEVRAAKSKMSDISNRANEIGRRITKLKTQLANLDKDNSGYTDDIVEQNKILTHLSSRMDEVQEAVIQVQVEAEHADLLAEMLGNGGLKSYIFDSVTPKLNEIIDKYAKVLDDIDVEISTVTKLKSGDYREKFNIKVNNPYGAGEYKGNSGGEKQKINLAVALGFNRILRELGGEAINVLFLDEPFESLDDGSSEQVIELCHMLDDIGNVMIITHQQGIKDLISNTVKVVKAGGMATIH